VNVAARIASQAGPGEVLVGADLVAATDRSAVRFELLGPASLKGLDFPVELFRASRG
jgi:class 3 adenylate cyclase